MVLRNTIIFIPAGETEVVKVEIYCGDQKDDTGLWDMDTNRVLLPTRLYNEFRNCKTQKEQAAFFTTLRKVSFSLIS